MGLYEFGLEVVAFFNLFNSQSFYIHNTKGFFEYIKDNETFTHYLDKRAPHLLVHLHNVVLRSTRDFRKKENELETKKQEYLETSESYEEAMSHIYTHQPEEAWQIDGGIEYVETLARKGHRVEETMRRRKLHDEAAKRKKKFVGIVSSGLGGLNFISVIEILGLDFGRSITVETLILGLIGLTFSVCSMLALHLGLVDFISSTRDFRVEVGKPVAKNLFPVPWKEDKAFLVCVAVTIFDCLFSSIGLIQGLAPMYRDDVFFQLAIICVSGLGSVINALLAWGIALDRLNFELQLKAEAVKQKEEGIDLQPYIKVARAEKRKLATLKEDISKLESEVQLLEAKAHAIYREWYRDLRIMQITDERDRRNLPRRLREALPVYEIQHRVNGHKPDALLSDGKRRQ